MTGSNLTTAVRTVAAGLRTYQPELREGQAAYLALHYLDPGRAAQIHGSDADPFYDDTRLPPLLGGTHMTGAWAATLDAILPPPGIDHGILTDPAALQAAATTAMRNTATRTGATPTALDTVLAALFAEPVSFNPIPPSRVNEGTPLSPADKTRIRQLLAAGGETAAVAEQVGCSVQAVAGVRVGMTKQKVAP